MNFEYKGKKYDTHKNNRLQVTKDEGLKRKFLESYWGKDWEKDDSTKLDLMFELALMSAKYEDIIEPVSDFNYSEAGTYPEWVLDAFEKAFVEKDLVDTYK